MAGAKRTGPGCVEKCAEQVGQNDVFCPLYSGYLTNLTFTKARNKYQQSNFFLLERDKKDEFACLSRFPQ